MILGIILLVFAYLLYKYSKSKAFDEPKATVKKHGADSCSSFVTCHQFPTTQQDQRYMDMIKRIDHTFKEQKEQMQVRAMKPHDSACMDPLFCTKSPCFIYAPDVIVATKVVALKTKQQRTAMRKKELGL